MNIEPITRRAFRLVAALTAAATLLLAGCGGGSDTGGASTPTNVTGKFVDATVVGIAYKCGTSTTVSGLTTASGEYTCPSGQAVAFYVGDILIGQVSSPLAVITPLDMVGAGATPSHTTVANIVRFLMSISSTDPATGTITIDPAVMTAAAGKTADFTAASASVLDTLIPTLKPGATIYTSAQAAAHVSASILGLFAGNYAGTYSGTYSGGWTVTIAADGTVSGQASGALVSGAMTTTLSTGSTYGFAGTAGGTPWVGTLNVSSKVFSGTWNDGAGSSGTWTGTVSSTPPVTTPTVTGFSPTSGAVGTVVTITGTNLGSFIPAPIVKFGTTVATPTYAGSTSITVAVPAGLAAGSYTITIGGLSGTPVTVGTFNVTATGGGAVVPAAPAGLTATTASATQINLSWTAVSGATSYNIYRSGSSGVVVSAANKINTGTVTASAFSSTGLLGATPYYFVVTAVNAAGESAASAQAMATTDAVPVGVAAPTTPPADPQQTMNLQFALYGTVANPPLPGQIRVFTSADTTVGEALNIYRSTSPNVAITPANLVTPTPVNKTISYGAAWYSFDDKALAAASKYYYRTALVNAAGEGPASTTELIGRTPLAAIGSGSGLTLSTAFKGKTTISNVIPYESSSGPYFASYFSDSSPARGFYVEYLNDAVNGDLLYFYLIDTVGGVDIVSMDVANALKKCAITTATGYPACSTLGITFDRAAGSITLAATPMKATAGPLMDTVFTLTGTLNFTPY